MKVKKISVAPIPATLQEMKFNASTPRQEALRLQANNTKEQVALMKAHHGGKVPNKTHTVPQFHTGVPCISGKCGNESSVVANKNVMTSKKNAVYDNDVIPADKMAEFLKKGGKKVGKKSRKALRKKTKKTKKYGKKSKRTSKMRKRKTRSRKSK